jgi:hypothetical protein
LTTPISNSIEGREVFFEFHRIGQYVKVTAMDVETLTEISIQGSICTAEAILKREALKRLEFVLNKKT